MDKNGIRGWLLLPALALVYAPISFVLNTIVPFFRDHGPYIKVRINYPILIGDLIILAMVAVVAWFFFTKKRIAPILFILYVIAMTLLWDTVDGLFESQNDPPFISMMFHCMVYIPYFVRSKRVAATFVNDLDASKVPDGWFVRLSPNLEAFYSRLVRTGWFIILLSILFTITGVLLNCALRSLRINGDLWHTFEYL